ncbi:MAG: hypothetical protein ACREJ2_02730 [Planctomycetota bacterium]
MDVPFRRGPGGKYSKGAIAIRRAAAGAVPGGWEIRYKIRAHEFACRAGHPALWTCDDLEGARLQANEAQTDWQPVVADDAPPLYHGFLVWRPVPECWGEKRVAVAQAVAAEELKLRKEITDTEAQEDSPRRAQRLAAIRRKVPC